MEPARQPRRAPDERSFERLYRSHRAAVYGALLRELGNREDAEDVTQTAFLDAYRALARGNEPDRPRAWLLTIAENARRRRSRALGRGPEQAELAREPAAAEIEVTARDLREGLDRLPENQRAALVLREVGGFSYAEIAGRLELSVASVQMLIFRARRALRAELEADVETGRAGAWLPWPWLGWVGGGGAAGVIPRAAGLVAAGVGAAALAGSSGPVPAPAPARHPQPPPVVGAAPVTDVEDLAPVVAPSREQRPAPAPRARISPAPPEPRRVSAAPPLPPPVAPQPEPPAAPAPAQTAPVPPAPVEQELPRVPAQELPRVPAALPLVPVELPEVRAPATQPELTTPTLSPTIPSVPAPPAGTDDLGGAALPGLPTS
jgi:RNA polymerase sigma-70 factor (ECF subfamily)